MKLEFKFADRVAESDRTEVVKQAHGLGAKTVRPLFPDDPDPTLASFYVVDMPDDADPQGLLTALRKSEAVESAEPEAKRWFVGT
jgi:hypothetical protein